MMAPFATESASLSGAMDDLSFVPLLSVIIVAHNDEREAAPLINEVRKALHGHVEYEIVYVDDGSTDGSFHTVHQMAGRLALLQVVQLSHSGGPTAALKAGIEHASGVWIATLDGSGTNDPSDIPAMFEMALQYEGQGPLLVAGHRGGAWKSGLRHLGDGLGGALRRLLLREDAGVDSGCMFTVCSRELWSGLPWFDHVQRYLPALVRRAGGRVISVPTNFRTRPKRPDKWGQFGLWAGFRDLLGVRWLQQRDCRVDVTPAPAVLTDKVRSRTPNP